MSDVRRAKDPTKRAASRASDSLRATGRVRTSETTVGYGTDTLDVLSEVAQQIQRLEVEKIRLIGVAQERGASWDQIGTALDVTRQAAWEKYRERVRDLLDAKGNRADHSEAESLESAANVLREIRRRRRSG